MSDPITLITGANGAIGFLVVLHALKANHTVRAVVRSQAKADLILSAASIQSLPESTRSHLGFAIVPDLLSSNAYDEALKGVTYVIHVASPIPGKANLGADQFDEYMIQPAVKGTINLLTAAEHANVKRVVVTSSVVAVLSLSNSPDSNKTIYNEKSRTADPSGPFTNEGQAYRASKILALNTAERWADNDGQGRRTELVHVLPALVLGANELARTKEELLLGSSGWALQQMIDENPFPTPLAGIIVTAEDIAELHVRALDETRVASGQSLIGAAHMPDGIDWKNGKEIIENAFPRAVENGILLNRSWAEFTISMKFDVSETEKITDMKFETFDKGLISIAGQYLDVIGEKRQ